MHLRKAKTSTESVSHPSFDYCYLQFLGRALQFNPKVGEIIKELDEIHAEAAVILRTFHAIDQVGEFEDLMIARFHRMEVSVRLVKEQLKCAKENIRLRLGHDGINTFYVI